MKEVEQGLVPQQESNEETSGKLYRLAKTDFIGYLREYTCRESPVFETLDDWYVSQVNSTDVFVFEKTGCPYCKSAKEILVEKQEQLGISVFFQPVDSELHALLKVALANELLTVPVIFIRGTYIGGSDDLRKLIDENDFVGRFEKPFSLFSPASGPSIEPAMCEQPGGGTCATFQLKSYGNIVRGYFFLQVLLLAVVLLMMSQKNYQPAFILYFVAFVDAALFTLTGPIPISPLGIISTRLMWSRRGPPVTLIPYKGISIFYLIGMIPQMVCIFKSSSAATAFPTCANVGTISYMTFNSSLLAVLRL